MKLAIIGLGQMGTHYVRKALETGFPEEAIIGIDVNPEKTAAARKSFPGIRIYKGQVIENLTGDPDQNDLKSLLGADAAIVATNTPSHHRILVDLMNRGIRQLFCEKPLGIDLAAVGEIRDAMVRTDSRIYTALLMNFSPALLFLMERMGEEGLVLTEGSVTWCKNRYGDKRPTPGDLEDETVHGVGILHSLSAIHQSVRSIDVMARLTYPEYASAEAQAKAHALDPSFPTAVNASTMALEIITTEKGEVPCILHSSFIGARQERRVTAVLARSDDPRVPIYNAAFDFDVKENGGIVDQLIITTLDGNKVEKRSFVCDKLLDQFNAFVAAASGGAIDPRLTDYNKAREAVAFTEAVQKSHRLQGKRVTAYTDADVVPVRKKA